MLERFVAPPRWLAIALFAGGLVAAGWRIPAAPPPVPEAVPPLQLAADELPPAARNSPHRASLTRLADGRPAVAWLGNGDAESAAIWLAIRDGKGWREIGRIASRESTAAAAFMHAQGVGHPILWAEGGWLHLWYEAYPLRRGTGASIMHSMSTDGGRNWSRTERLESGPFGGFGPNLGLVPKPLADGGLLLPLAPEGSWLRLAATGQVIEKLQLPMAAAPPEAARP
ncbi:exo-alpha-sialidase [Dechloromonas sp. XY25]|uniref:Exo-alpha-sialidase n=1 Tax=Dechloromonas hankyongensis TaxID=2908002 RepID=A0ABS9JZR8_9RHOO|nr:exo-alpha-sialidase [Dechloromonas hankyongensis]MCG2576408.1 exo-alpha-sialidase [Dechloromonas hankyongensis]